ncbi:MAG TPA: geranylgeranyl reductase family protein [Candidatus Latescibacteria bacterium]|nr:geranylgeranyl reductase family protein [Candidatus Latescibacterota bacterium]
MREYDVIVVGAGPSGSASAYFLAREGLSVLLLEKERLPRPKVCAGAVPLAVEGLLGFGVGEAVEGKVQAVTWIWRSDRATWRYPEPVLYTVMRDRLDALLVSKARAAGAQVLEGERAVRLDEGRNEVLVFTERGRYRCKFLVGADGAGSIVARYVGDVDPRRVVSTAEAEIWMPYEFLKACRGRAFVEIGAVPRGYGWVFPKADHLSAGIGGLGLRGVRKHLEGFLRSRLPGPVRMEVRIWAYPLWGARRRWVRGRMLLVGDAGAFANPLTGAGIYTGIWSGLLAAESLKEALSRRDLEDAYIRRVLGKMAPELYAARNLGLVYAFPGLTFRVFQLGLFRRNFLRGSYLGIWRHLTLGLGGYTSTQF